MRRGVFNRPHSLSLSVTPSNYLHFFLPEDDLFDMLQPLDHCERRWVRAVCNCEYGNVARVVYSRTFPTLTTPLAGRLNKSPHTVLAIATRHRREKNAEDGQNGGR